jgi:hypothetical protein
MREPNCRSTAEFEVCLKRRGLKDKYVPSFCERMIVEGAECKKRIIYNRWRYIPRNESEVQESSRNDGRLNC